MNATELARNKFDALFADHDAKAISPLAKQQKPTLKIVKKATLKNVKPQ